MEDSNMGYLGCLSSAVIHPRAQETKLNFSLHTGSARPGCILRSLQHFDTYQPIAIKEEKKVKSGMCLGLMFATISVAAGLVVHKAALRLETVTPRRCPP